MSTALETLRRRDPNFDDALHQAIAAAKKLTRPGSPGVESFGFGVGVNEAEIDNAANAIEGGEVESALGTAGGLMVEAIVRGTLRPSFYMSKDKVLSDRKGISELARRLMEEMELDFSDRELFDANAG